MKWLRLSFANVLPDQLLVYQAKHGDRKVFGKLYLKYLDPVFRYVYFRVNQDRIEAEDLTQNVFFKAWEKLVEFRGDQFRAWLYTIAHHLVVDYFRRQKTRVGLDEELSDNQKTPEEETIQDEEIRALRQAMKGLTDKQKQVITLKYIEGLPTHEIAKIMNKNEAAVRALSSRALKKLRQLLKSYE